MESTLTDAQRRARITGAAKLRDDLIEHIHLENNVLFPRFQDQETA